MGCVVNGPGESKAANLGISLPGTGEAPTCPVFVDGAASRRSRAATRSSRRASCALVDDYVATRYPRRAGGEGSGDRE